MFYKTTIKSVTQSGVIDVQGRSLQFIGYLPVKAGDTVYTDGRFIFGNAPPKGAPAIFDTPSGIPVLSDDLRGYFNNRGTFKQYSIAGTKWLVNDDKTFKHDEGDNIIDAEISEDGELLTVKKHHYFPNPYAVDYDYHEGFYSLTPSSAYGALSLIRVAVLCEGDRYIFYNHPVVGFQDRGYPYAEYYGMNEYYRHAPFYYNTGKEAYNSYEGGFYSAFKNLSTGYGVPLQRCYFLLRGQDSDYRNADGVISKQCSLIFRKDNKVFQRVTIGDLLKTFEDTAKAEVDLMPNRESVKHLKSRAIVRNFKIKAADDWELLLEAEIWASNTFYNNAEEPVSHDPLILDTNPFHISSTVSHRHLLIKFKADGTYEEIFKWHFLYPLQLRDSTFEGYSDTEPEPDGFEEGAWVIRTTKASVYHEDGTEYWYSEIWRDYDSRREAQPLNYDEPTFEVNDFDFPVQDDYRAKITICDAEKDEEIDIDKWQLDGIVDADNKPVIGAILQDETDAHKWNMSCASLKGGGCLFGIHKDDHEIDGALYKIDDKGTVEQVGDGLKNFRLRELKKISKAKK